MMLHFNADILFLGKLDSWEWDSGARDMSPVPKTIGRRHTHGKYQDDTFKVGFFHVYIILFKKNLNGIYRTIFLNEA